MRNLIPVPGGRFLNHEDINLRRRVVFLGGELAHDLFGDIDPVGKQMLINAIPYTVIGVLEKQLQMGTYGGGQEPCVIDHDVPGADRPQFLGLVVARPTEHGEDRARRGAQGIRGEMQVRPEDERVVRTWDTVEGEDHGASPGHQGSSIIGGLTLIRRSAS
jgi:putative ABC transport system permease protein